jgi:hypothetical protein
MPEVGTTDPLRMTEAERERAIHDLRESFARSEVTDEEFDRKLNALFAASSSAELEELVPPRPAGVAPASDRDAVEAHLSPGERVEWVGKPDASRRFTRADLFLVPFSIVWCAFAIFWEASAVAGADSAFFGLWGIPFVAMGLYLVFGRFVYKANRRRRTTYAVTSRRVMCIVRSRRGESVQTMYLSAIPNISTSASSNGHGSVAFGSSAPTGWYADTGMEFLGRGQPSSSVVGFSDIEDPRGVADLVERLRDADGQYPAPHEQ